MTEHYRPTNELRRVLEELQAPDEARSSIARRTGLVVARGQLSVAKVQATINQTMFEGNGLPNWKRVDEKIGMTVRDIYRKSKRSW